MKRLAPAAILVILAFSTQTDWVHGQQKGTISQFMRQKLKLSQNVLEGLSVENFEMIARNARAMNTLSEAAEWKVLPGPEYVGFSTEFQRLNNELIRQANKKNLEAATLAYVGLTINCINCHRHVRDTKGPTAPSATPKQPTAKEREKSPQ